MADPLTQLTNLDARKKLLILGASGLAGSALQEEAKSRNFEVFCASQKDSDIQIDVRDESALRNLIEKIQPDIIINSIAIVNIKACEENHTLAWEVNARPAAILAQLAQEWNFRIIQISTDHFFQGNKNKKHTETDEVVLLNEYARTKFAAEALALTWENSIVVRTNIVGIKRYPPPSFAQWCLNVIDKDEEVTLFDDQFVSSIDIWSFSKAIFDLLNTSYCGIINLASRDCFSKADFVLQLAKQKGRSLTKVKIGSHISHDTRRPDSLGLDVSKIEKLLGYSMPNLQEVCAEIEKKSSNKGINI